MKINERATQVWSVLVLAARNQQVLSYAMIEKLTGIDKRAVGRALEPIQRYCKREKLPPLTVLVVNESTGLPSEGFTEARDIFGAQARVFVYNWHQWKAPQPEDF
jgi:putative restriction endonuclease